MIDHLDLEVPSGSLVAVLGASGSGKTTLLRIWPDPNAPNRIGALRRAGRRPRGSGCIFVPAGETPGGHRARRRARCSASECSGNVGFRAAARRDGSRPHEGARAGADGGPMPMPAARSLRWPTAARRTRPRPGAATGGVVLLDEPFSSLDATLRTHLRARYADYCAQGTTALLVTHDQEEALSTADLVAVMPGGRIVRAGSPREVYDAPVDLRVAIQSTFDRTGLTSICGGGLRSGRHQFLHRWTTEAANEH